jgi:hypothetical protein
MILRRPTDRNLYLAAAVLFPLLVLLGYSRTYYLRAFFDVAPLANSLVYIHGAVMSLWVVYFTAQIALIRTKNIKLHMSLGLAGIVLAALVIVVGMATAYDSHIVRQSAPPGMNPYTFFIVPLSDLFLFILFFTGAIIYRKRPTEHKSLMLLTAINFLPAPLGRMPLVPEKYFILFVFGVPALIAIICLVWLTVKQRKLNRIFALAVLLFVISQPLKMMIGFSEGWIRLVGWVFS